VRALAIATGFNKALAINLGAYHARAETLFLLDADIELAPDTCAAALACVSERRAVVLDRVVESSPTSAVDYPYVRSVVHTFELETSAGEVVRVETNRQRLADGSRSAPGMVFVPKRCFEDVGGMNSDLTGWGWEDLDLLVRLQLGARMEVARAGAATHLTHGDDVRRVDGTSRAANEARNATMCVANYGLGHYLGTYDDDVATWLPKD